MTHFFKVVKEIIITVNKIIKSTLKCLLFKSFNFNSFIFLFFLVFNLSKKIKLYFFAKYLKIVLFNYNDFLCIEVKVKNVLKMIFSTIFKKYGTIN
jgi:hypothetical protein